VSLFAAKQALRLRYFVVQSLPGVVISISVKDRNNDKLELVDQASDLLVLAISSNELLSNIRDNGRSNPFYRSQYMFGEYFFLVSGVFVWWDACGQISHGPTTSLKIQATSITARPISNFSLCFSLLSHAIHSR
jgi:hypothetical protein